MNTLPEPAATATSERLNRLLAFIEVDPTNATLLGDAAACAFDTQQLDLCDQLLARQQALGNVPPASVNLRGLCAMARGHFAEALDAFAALSKSESDPAIRYNMAYASAMLGRFDEALAPLSEEVMVAVQQGIPLRMRSLHHLGRLDEVIELGRQHADRPPHDPEICGLLATALFDAGDLESARQYATRAAEFPDGLAVTGLLALNEGRSGGALALFARVLEARPDNSRARLGAGLALLEQQRFEQAAQQIDAAARSFKVHAGSWVAAGWAHLLNGDLARARTSFEEGGRVDRGFAEVPGALAIVAIKEGKLDDARAHTKVALRLDPACLSAALAQSLLSAQAGHHAAAGSILDAALNRPIDAQGRTIAQALARRMATLPTTPTTSTT
jgi:tetratricopeptide (TPR) repeat protein